MDQRPFLILTCVLFSSISLLFFKAHFVDMVAFLVTDTHGLLFPEWPAVAAFALRWHGYFSSVLIDDFTLQPISIYQCVTYLPICRFLIRSSFFTLYLSTISPSSPPSVLLFNAQFSAQATHCFCSLALSILLALTVSFSCTLHYILNFEFTLVLNPLTGLLTPMNLTPTAAQVSHALISALLGVNSLQRPDTP